MGNIFTVLDRIAEEKIREAMENGEFDNLPGKGKPLHLEDDRHIPSDLRLSYKILKNADCLPPELELRKEIVNTKNLLAGIQDTQEKYKHMQRLNYLIMKLNILRPSSPLLQEGQGYYEKIIDNMSARDEKGEQESKSS